MAAQMRQVKLWDADIRWETRENGAIYIWQDGALGTYPDQLSDRIAQWAKCTPDALWMAERGPDGDWRKTTYAQMHRDIQAIGEGLLELGLSEQRPLVILSGNSVAHALMALGAQYAGIPSAAIAPAYSLTSKSYEKLGSVRDQITPGGVFVEDAAPFAAAIETVFPDVPLIARVGSPKATSFDRLRETVPTDRVQAANAATSPDTVAKFLFTSGTTGAPKAVIQTQRMLCSNMEMVTDCFAYLRDEPPVMLDWAPWNHVAAGNLIFNAVLYNGGALYLDDGLPTPDGIARTARNLQEIETNWYWNVPVGFEMLLERMREDPALAQTFFKRVKLIYYAGAAMAQHTWDELKKLSVDTIGEEVLITTALGSTETAPMALFQTEPQDHPGNVGIPAKGLTLKLVPNEGKWEARVKGPSITPGYWRNDKLTAEAFDDEGYYMLGDALRFKNPDDPSEGFFFDGRVAENFKMATGTWVAVGALRAKVINALGGLARDVVIAGEGRDYLGALVVPFRPAIEAIVPGGAELPDAELYAHPDLRAHIARLLGTYNAGAGGSSNRVTCARILEAPLDLDKGEVTDKGSVNQRAVLRHREDIAESLFADHPAVIEAST